MIHNKDPLVVIEEAQYMADISQVPQVIIRSGLDLTYTDIGLVDPREILEVIRPGERKL
jgi:hypothetical protein